MAIIEHQQRCGNCRFLASVESAEERLGLSLTVTPDTLSIKREKIGLCLRFPATGKLAHVAKRTWWYGEWPDVWVMRTWWCGEWVEHQ